MSRLNPKNLLCLLLAAVLIMLALAASQASANDATREFLLQFRNTFNAVKTLWPDTSSDYCTWNFVSCDNNDTVFMNLVGQGLAGKLPVLSEEYQNTENGIRVRSIWLSNNPRLTGSLDVHWEYLINLTSLDLQQTSLSGTLPQAWESLSLRELKLNDARICGSLPNWRMPSLEWVTLSNNSMGGSLSASWSDMTSLRYATVYDNAFCGCVPDSWASNPVLSVTASRANPGARAADCATKNPCSSADICKSTSANASGVASLVASVAAIAAVAATMVF